MIIGKKNLQSFYFVDGKPICPLTVGVTGHREIKETELQKIKEKTEQFFKTLCLHWKNKHRGKNVPILVFNGMAEGADQLVAEIVCELREKPETNCLKLVAVTPMPMEYYREDFKTAEALRTFDAAMAGADAILELPLTKENQKLTDLGQEIHHTEQYVSLGKFLATNSFILLALWDGKDLETASPGGTGNVVRMKLDGCECGPLLEKFSKDFQPSKAAWEVGQSYGGIFQIETPRATSPVPATGIETRRWSLLDINSSSKEKNDVFSYHSESLSVEGFFGLKSIARPIQFMAEANLDTMKNFRMDSEDFKNSREWLMEKYRPNPEGNLEFITKYFMNFDTLAISYQKKFYRAALRYIILGILLAIAFYAEAFTKNIIFSTQSYEISLNEGFSIAPTNKTLAESNQIGSRIYLDGFYYIILICLVIFHIDQRRRTNYERYHRYRALAEALRVQIFWYIAEIPERVMENYHYHPIGALDWLRNSVNTILIPCSSEKDFSEDHPDLRFLHKRWVLDQKGYFFSNLKSNHAEKQRQKNSSAWQSQRWSYWGTLFTSLAVFWLFLRILVSRIEFTSVIWHWSYFVFIVIFATCGALAVACYMYDRFRCYTSVVKRYANIFPIFHICDKKLQKEIERQKEIIGETNGANEKFPISPEMRMELYRLGIYALRENADWFLIVRKFELPR